MVWEFLGDRVFLDHVYWAFSVRVAVDSAVVHPSIWPTDW